MNWGQMRTFIRTRLADPNGKMWTDGTLLSFLNDDVVPDVMVGSEATLKRQTIPLLNGSIVGSTSARKYTLPDDCYDLRGVRINGRKTFGTDSVKLENLDRTYLTRTGIPQWYYAEDTNSVSFYPVPSWTASLNTFTSEFGVVTRVVDSSTTYLVTSEFGVVVSALDLTGAIQFVETGLQGEMDELDAAQYVAEVTYIFQNGTIVNDTDTLDLPDFMHYACCYAVLEHALNKECQGKNPTLANYFGARAEEVISEWKARSLEWEQGEDQYPSQRPVNWGSDLDWRMRVYP